MRHVPAVDQAERIATLTQSFLDAFRDGVVPARLARTLLIPEAAPSRRWTAANRLLAALQNHEIDPRGFRQWQEVGRRVKKGARAAFILGPRLARVRGVEADPGGEPGNIDRAAPDGTSAEDERRLVGFVTIPVFSFDRTEGEPLSADRRVERFLTSLPLRGVAESWGIRVEPALPSRVYWGFFSPAAGGAPMIGLTSDSLLTWAHELVHASDERLDPTRYHQGRDDEREVVAELGGATLLAFLGLDDATDRGTVWRYLLAQTDGSPAKALSLATRLLERTAAAVEQILDAAAGLAGDIAA